MISDKQYLEKRKGNIIKISGSAKNYTHTHIKKGSIKRNKIKKKKFFSLI
jgi:hypothetical protein